MKQLLITIAAIFILTSAVLSPIGCNNLKIKKRVFGEYTHLKQKFVFDEDGTVKIYWLDDGTFRWAGTWYVKINGQICVEKPKKDGFQLEKYRLSTWKVLDNGNLARYLPTSRAWVPAVKIVK